MCCFFIITDNHLTLNRMKSGSQSAKSHILRDMMTTFKKNTIIRIRRALLQVCLHTQEGICPDDRSFQCRRKYRHSADVHRNNTVGMEYNTNIRKKQKLNNVLCTKIEV